jgi:hypothetical protein
MGVRILWLRAGRNGQGIGPGRRVGETNLKDERSYLHLVPFMQETLTDNALTVDKRAAAAAKVANAHLVPADEQLTVLPAYPIAVGANVALAPTAEKVLAPWE